MRNALHAVKKGTVQLGGKCCFHSESQCLHRWRTVSALELRPDSVTYAPRFQRGQVIRKACVVGQAILEDRRRQGVAGD